MSKTQRENLRYKVQEKFCKSEFKTYQKKYYKKKMSQKEIDDIYKQIQMFKADTY